MLKTLVSIVLLLLMLRLEQSAYWFRLNRSQFNSKLTFRILRQQLAFLWKLETRHWLFSVGLCVWFLRVQVPQYSIYGYHKGYSWVYLALGGCSILVNFWLVYQLRFRVFHLCLALPNHCERCRLGGIVDFARCQKSFSDSKRWSGWQRIAGRV